MILYDELEEMVSYPKSVTGVSNTVFISPKGYARHGPSIKIAIDPPNRIDPRSKVAVIDLNGRIVAGKIDPALLDQARRFIELNRTTLIEYWNYQINTEQLRNQIKMI